jgi:hypothetical protein
MGMSIHQFMYHKQVVDEKAAANWATSRWAQEFRAAGYFSACFAPGDIGRWQAAHTWCCEQFGSNHYAWVGNQFWFESEEHAVLFALKWA